jgi:predicted O-methyltransferase YrrM
MFHTIPDKIRERMEYLERMDQKDRSDGTHQLKRLRQIPPEVGKFLALMASSAPPGKYLEVGTSAGYSTLWLALACRETGRRITTFEVLDEKIRFASETFDKADVLDVVELIAGDARQHLSAYKDVAFCFLDAEKDHYLDCYEAVVPNLVRGGLLVADNVISHRSVLEPLIQRANEDTRVDAVIVPIGWGELVCRRTEIE